MPAHCKAERRGERVGAGGGGGQRRMRDSDCGVSHCAAAEPPSVHVHCIQQQALPMHARTHAHRHTRLCVCLRTHAHRNRHTAKQ